MYISDPKYITFTNYNTVSSLVQNINETIDDLYLSNVTNTLKDVKNITKGDIFLHITYDSDYYCVLIEKCVFVGYLFSQLNNIKNNNSDYVLLFHSLDLQNNIEISSKNISNEIYTAKDNEKILDAIKSYFFYYKDLKSRILDKIEKVNKAILLLNEIRISDEKTIISPQLKKYSDVFPEDNLLNKTINNLIAMNELYYKSNNVYTLEGLKNDAEFIQKIKEMLNSQTKKLLGLDDESINDEDDESDDTEYSNQQQITKLREEEAARLEDNKQLF